MDDIIIKNLTKSYNGKIVLNNLNLTIKSGKTTCIMAPSGMGKTTLLRIILGLEAPDSGTISGLDNLRISAVFQENRLCEYLTPINNIKLVNPTLTDKQILEAINLFGLSGCEYQKTSELSGGMKRRIAILRAILADYDLLVLDEPFTAIDINTKETVIREILKRTKGKTIIFVTHDESEASLMGINRTNIQTFCVLDI
jgi:NitT/TauT family transport system ATP-binding protein